MPVLHIYVLGKLSEGLECTAALRQLKHHMYVLNFATTSKDNKQSALRLWTERMFYCFYPSGIPWMHVNPSTDVPHLLAYCRRLCVFTRMQKLVTLLTLRTCMNTLYCICTISANIFECVCSIVGKEFSDGRVRTSDSLASTNTVYLAEPVYRKGSLVDAGPLFHYICC